MDVIITRPAKDIIREMAIKNSIKPQVRIYAEQATCCRAKFAIAFDKPDTGDEVTYVDEIAIITDREYMPRYARVLLLDYCTEGFIIEAYVRPEKNCAKSPGCGGCSGCSHK